MTEALKGKVAAVTGAASGIGLACATAMLAAGATGLLRRPRRRQARSALPPSSGPNACPLVVDLTRPRAASPACCRRSSTRRASLDIFHANAGAYVGGRVVEGDPDAWDRMLNLNVNAVLPLDPRGPAAHGRAQDAATSSSRARSPASCRWSGSRSTPPRSSPCRPSSTPSAARSRQHGVRVGAVAPGAGRHGAPRRLAEGQDGGGARQRQPDAAEGGRRRGAVHADPPARRRRCATW